MAKKLKRVKRSPKVKAVMLPRDGIVKVAVPVGVVPVVAHVGRTVEIAPVPVQQKKSWMQRLFGD